MKEQDKNMIGISWKNGTAVYAVTGDQESLVKWLKREEYDFRERELYSESRGMRLVKKTGIRLVPVAEYLD